jgi:hypothetical protein
MRRALGALPTTFVVHLVMVAVALLPAVVLGAFLSATTGTLGADVTPQGVWIELLAGAGRGGPVGFAFLAAAGITLLSSAPIQMTWLFALDGAPGRSALRSGLARTPAAWALGLLVFAFGALALLASLCLPLGAHLFVLRDVVNDRLHDLVILGLSLPALIVVVCAACARDLARAALIDSEASVFVALRSALGALRSSRPLFYVGFFLVEALLTALSLATSVRGGSAVLASVGIITAQLLLFARTFTRSVWLSRCLRPEAALTPDNALH